MKDYEIQENFLRSLAKVYTDYDISLIKDYIAEDIKYNSMWVLQELTNKEEYLDYLTGKLATLKKLNIKKKFMLLYEIGSECPMLMSEDRAPDGSHGVFIADNNQEGKIQKLSIMAVDFFHFFYKNKDKEEFEQFQRITKINAINECDLPSLFVERK